MRRTEKLIVKRIIDLVVSGNCKEDEIIDMVEKEFKIPNEEIPSVIELIKTGLFRAQLISKGTQYPESNYRRMTL